MPLNLIHGPPNSGRAGLVRARFGAALEREPVLVVPTVDDVFAFERELCEGGAMLGGSVLTFGALFSEVAIAGGFPPGPKLTPSQRLRAISAAMAERQRRLGPLRRSAGRPGFAAAFGRLLDELQAAGLDPDDVAEAGAGTLESSAYLNDLASLFAGYAEMRQRLGRGDSHAIAREAIALLRARGAEVWGERPLFLYGLDDLTPEQLELVAAVAATAEVTVAIPYEEGRAALAARAGLLAKLRDRIGVAEETLTEPEPANTDSRLLFHLERSFGALGAERPPPGDDLVLLRSAGARGEAEAIGAEVAKLVWDGAEPGEIAIALRDPARRGPQIAAVLESYGLPVALEAAVPIAATAVGGALLALLEAEFGRGRAADLLRYMRGPSGIPAGKIDWLERSLRRKRVGSTTAALELWERGGEPLPPDLTILREAASSSQPAAAVTAAKLAAAMASRLRGGRGGFSPAEESVELRAAGAIANTLTELAELGRLAPAWGELAATVETIELRAWSGPVGDRIRIADPYRLRAGRFDHVVVASLQEGEFPRRDDRGERFLSDAQRDLLGLDPRRDAEAEERYLFYVCLSLPRKRLFLSYRDSDENGVAEPRSPLVDEVVRLLSPPADGSEGESVERSITRVRGLAQVVHPIDSAPSEDELARSIAARDDGLRRDDFLAAAGVEADEAARISARLEAARTAEAAARAPGPLANPAVLQSLAAVPAYGGTTLEEFDLCSYRWFVAHELEPQPLDPAPDPLVQGGLMHAALERLYRERPGGTALPRPASLAAWTRRGCELVAAIAAERGMVEHPAERAIVRRVERLLTRFLGEEAERETGGFEPWLLEAAFGHEEDCERPALELGDWGLHGAIDRVDRAADGRTLVVDYKLSSAVVPREKLEERAKLQLQLYLTAVAELWEAEPVGGLYHPLRGSSARRPRGLIREDAAADLAAYRLYDNDVLEREEFEALLEEARTRAGAIVARMRAGDIRRDPGPRPGLRGHDVCPSYCEFATICRRDRAPVVEDEEAEDR